MVLLWTQPPNIKEKKNNMVYEEFQTFYRRLIVYKNDMLWLFTGQKITKFPVAVLVSVRLSKIRGNRRLKVHEHIRNDVKPKQVSRQMDYIEYMNDVPYLFQAKTDRLPEYLSQIIWK
jgi:hypothetical protein